MLAILYIAAMIFFGDCLCRRFFRFSSVQHQFATAFISGLVLSSGISYLGAVGFAWTGQPLLAGNLVFLVCAVAAFFLSRQKKAADDEFEIVRPKGNDVWDWAVVGIGVIFGWWLMITTLSYHDGNFLFGIKSWSDFGANVSLTQSFALGNNFPSEHPFFPGEPLRYHFLFWFQAANLSYLGINVVWAINLLSIISLFSLLILILTFTEILFNSRVAARLAVVLFFFPATSLSYILFLKKQTSLSEAFNAIIKATVFLPTGYPYRGEDWGGLTVAVFANQRQLIGGMGILLIVLIFLIDFYRRNNLLADKSEANKIVDSQAEKNPESSPEQIEIESSENKIVSEPENESVVEPTIEEKPKFDVQPWIFSGVLLGALPYWNSAVFVSAAILFASIFLLLPFRRYLVFLIGAMVVTGLPQILLLRSGNLAPTTYSFFHWGFTIEKPTIPLVAEYIVWLFGFKLIILLIAVWFSNGLQRRLLLAVTSLVAVVFLFQLSTDAFNNHKLLNIWNVFAAIYAAFALWRVARKGILTAALAVVLTIAMIFTSIIEFFPVYHDPDVVLTYEKDRLANWLLTNTKPDDIFLTQTLLSHQILFTGRRVFLANTLFAWTAGYDVTSRETVYRKLFQEFYPPELYRLLKENKIAYVAIDNALRRNDLLKGTVNERIYFENFEQVFVDSENRYDNLVIFKVPDEFPVKK